MKIGVMVGTFDPFHRDHLTLATAALAERRVDRVIVVPTGIAWHRKAAPVASAADRLRMAVLGTSTQPSVSVSDIDLRGGEPTFTANTLRAIARLTGHRFGLSLIVGSDTYLTMPGWREIEWIVRSATIVVRRRCRDGIDSAVLPGARVEVMEAVARGISATSCRAALGDGGDTGDLLPRQVLRYIRFRGLYVIPDPESAVDPILNDR